MATPLPLDGDVRVAVVGLGQIAELVLPTYLERDDVQILALCDLDPDALSRWGSRCPGAYTTTSLDALLHRLATDGVDVVDVLVPTPAHSDVVCAVLDAGFHVQVQKPLARDLAGADRMLASIPEGATLRVLEDYLFFPPLVTMKRLVDDGEIGDPVGVHMKIVATGRGGWDIPEPSLRWQMEQALDGRGMMVFDHGWHQFALATWLFGPIRRVFAWLGRTEVVPGVIEMDAPSTLVWEHASGVRAVLEISFAIDTYFRSSHYTGDERVEVTGTRGFVRTNRISAQGIQAPAVVLYRDGETRSFHDLDDRPPDAFRASTAHALAHYRGEVDELVMDAKHARHVLATLMAAFESNRAGVAVDVD
jgi:predicted dehydrogenase